MAFILRRIFGLLSILLLTSVHASAFAHPGNTSWDGCHYCKTNCSKWGYTYGTRHCHNGGSPQFGEADPLHYSASGAQCAKKYPGTTYRSSDWSCVCPGKNPLRWNKKTYCK